jgi:hypothetical protein
MYSINQATNEDSPSTPSATILSTQLHKIDEEGDIILELLEWEHGDEDLFNTTTELSGDNAEFLAAEMELADDNIEEQPQKCHQVEILVSSAMPRRVSPVFGKIFAPSYSSEGTMIESNTKLRKVTRFSLPDDDPQTMLLLCLLIYHRLPQDYSPSFDTLVGLAMLVHKYDLRDLVRF